jgi:hypothetical protein
MERQPEPTGEGAVCPDCGEWLQFRFACDFKDVAHMTINDEWVSLEPFPVELYCRVCAYVLATVGREFTIDMKEGVILYGHIDGPEKV